MPRRATDRPHRPGGHIEGSARWPRAPARSFYLAGCQTFDAWHNFGRATDVMRTSSLRRAPRFERLASGASQQGGKRRRYEWKHTVSKPLFEKSRARWQKSRPSMAVALTMVDRA
jgi:hypothetical protein